DGEPLGAIRLAGQNWTSATSSPAGRETRYAVGMFLDSDDPEQFGILVGEPGQERAAQGPAERPDAGQVRSSAPSKHQPHLGAPCRQLRKSSLSMTPILF